jgi:NADPH-dependent curcumin reductase CurA
MLNRICLADGIPLVNVVRKPTQVELLRAQGATHVVNSTDPDFEAQLTDALAETGATVAFDATGGGELGSQLLNAMERAALRSAGAYSRYGSTTYKQLYIYGGLDRSPTVLKRAFGFSWGIGGWLLPPFLERLGQEGADRLRARVVAELHSTFASHYAARITLSEALDVETLKRYAQQATGEKFLITPHLA